MNSSNVIVVGAGVSGLTVAALLANEGVDVILLESHSEVGGCAGTFKRGKYTFDVGATQVAGLENEGIHNRIFKHINAKLIDAQILDPACQVQLGDGSDAVRLWHSPKRWQLEREKHFPGTSLFWELCEKLHQINWSFNLRDPILPVRNVWDLYQLLKAIRPLTICSGILSTLTIFDLLKFTGLANNKRLKKFLDLQLKLYSQEPLERTSALYGATVLQMAQAPLGLYHLQGSMQSLSDNLKECFVRDGGNLYLSHTVKIIELDESTKSWTLKVVDKKGKMKQFTSTDVICTVPPQSLKKLLSRESTKVNNYLKKLEKIPTASGAVVFYGAIKRYNLPLNIPYHLQLNSKEFGSFFISISIDGDGRAPIGEATIISSIFTSTENWKFNSSDFYDYQKQDYLTKILMIMQDSLGINKDMWIHKELATPRSFQKWTGRLDGVVGGLGQFPLTSGLFGLSSRTPLPGFWLCGDSVHPGEGTAGVSQSALMVCRQLLKDRGYSFNLKR